MIDRPDDDTLPPLDAPPGLVRLDDHLRVRRFGPIRHGQITCAYGHPIKLQTGALQSAVPQCTHRMPPDGRQRCTAHVYLYRVSRSNLQLLDLSPEEARLVLTRRMDYDDVIAYFGLSLLPYRTP